MALYGLYFKEKSERVFKVSNIVPDDPEDRVEANSPVIARINFIRKLKLSFKQFQKLYCYWCLMYLLLQRAVLK